MYLDQRDRVWTTTKTRHLFVLAVRPGAFSKVADYDLTSVLNPAQGLTSALPAFSGKIWFVSKRGGVVGLLDPRSGRIRATHADSEIENTFAVGRDGIYIVSEKSMYRFDLAAGGRPTVTWRSRYRNSGIHKPGQVDAGSGTTPTIMPGGYVSITDNADPMDVVVYRTAAVLRHGQRRVVCQVPVFHKGASDTENSLVGSGRSMIVENNYGYRGFSGPGANALTSPGFARVDIDRSGQGCHRAWQTFKEAAPSVVSKLSTKTGLIYTYARGLGSRCHGAGPRSQSGPARRCSRCRPGTASRSTTTTPGSRWGATATLTWGRSEGSRSCGGSSRRVRADASPRLRAGARSPGAGQRR